MGLVAGHRGRAKRGAPAHVQHWTQHCSLFCKLTWALVDGHPRHQPHSTDKEGEAQRVTQKEVVEKGWVTLDQGSMLCRVKKEGRTLHLPCTEGWDLTWAGPLHTSTTPADGRGTACLLCVPGCVCLSFAGNKPNNDMTRLFMCTLACAPVPWEHVCTCRHAFVPSLPHVHTCTWVFVYGCKNTHTEPVCLIACTSLWFSPVRVYTYACACLYVCSLACARLYVCTLARACAYVYTCA